MFDFDAGKLIVFGIVALAVIPPKELPRVLRTVGKYVGQMRRMAAQFQGQFEAAIKEAEFESIKKELNEINEAANVDTSFDPASLMRDNLEKAVEDKSAPEVHDETVAETEKAHEIVSVELPAPPPEPVTVEAALPAEKATSSAT
jgi:sec-independent protein translocase protein TatB